MKNALRAFGAIAVLWISGCPQEVEPPKELPTPPKITSFTASATRIDPGEAITLSFTAENATAAEILDGKGTVIPFAGTALDGTSILRPEATDVYVLRVSGEGGRDTAFTRVAVNEDLEDVFLALVPPMIESGDSSQLLWSAFRARTARIEVSGGEDIVLDPTAEPSGVIEVTPARGTTYRLVAAGVDPEAETIVDASLQVQAVLEAFTLSTQAAKVGETITASWKTRGADEVVLSEATFGELLRVAAPAEVAQVDEGAFEWTVPASLPSGLAIVDGQPLRFTLSMKQTGAAAVERRIKAFVGEGPRIDDFSAPDAVTAGRPVPLSWTTTNATQVEIRVNGLTVFSTLPSDPARAASGSYSLRGIGENLEVELLARSFLGTEVSERRTVLRVPGPEITAFEMPASIASVGDAAAATWTTANATYVALRPLGGPVAFATSNPAQVAAGTADVYPGHTMTWVLEAWNLAGDRVSQQRTVVVQSPGNATAAPSPALPGSQITISWDLNPTVTQNVIGLPFPTPAEDTASSTWVELDGHPFSQDLSFVDTNDGIAELQFPVPFRFPVFDGTRDALFVSTNGFVAFADVGPMLANVDLSVSSGLEVLAPFWDNLDLGVSGSVIYLLEGTTFPRRLIVQWNKVTLVSNSTAELTFQVQLREDGQVTFVYQTLTGTNSAGEQASIGVKLADGVFHSQLGFDQASVAAGEAYIWFSGAGPVGSVQLIANKTSSYSFFQLLQNGRYVSYSLPVWVFGAGSLVVNEAMPAPGAGVAAGKWIEIFNAQAVPVDVGGVKLTSSGMTTAYELPSMIVPARSYFLLGESLDPVETGGAAVGTVWSGVTLDGADEIQLEILGTTISSLEWSTSVAGESVQTPERAIDAQGAPNACERTRTFGAGSWIGTPGAANETCFEYNLREIPVAYEDIAATGVEILASASDYTGIGTFALDKPFPYFGEMQTEFHVSMCGFLKFGAALTSAYNTTNDVVPGTAVPSGTVAPFWDEIVRNTNGRLLMLRKADHTIVSWQDFRIYATTSQMNFQVKLFDDGAIEFHYGPFPILPTGTRANYISGQTATSWIERLDGSGALPININTVGGILPKTAWRFTPNN